MENCEFDYCIPISVSLPRSVVLWADENRKKYELSRSNFIKNIVLNAMQNDKDVHYDN